MKASGFVDRRVVAGAVRRGPERLVRILPGVWGGTGQRTPLTSYTAAATEMPARVWVAGASVTITGPSGTVVAAMPGEINATGAIVFGYNWRPSVPGIYQLMFHVPEGTVTFANPADTVKSVTVTAGGGGRR